MKAYSRSIGTKTGNIRPSISVVPNRVWFITTNIDVVVDVEQCRLWKRGDLHASCTNAVVLVTSQDLPLSHIAAPHQPPAPTELLLELNKRSTHSYTVGKVLRCHQDPRHVPQPGYGLPLHRPAFKVLSTMEITHSTQEPGSETPVNSSFVPT